MRSLELETKFHQMWGNTRDRPWLISMGKYRKSRGLSPRFLLGLVSGPVDDKMMPLLA